MKDLRDLKALTMHDAQRSAFRVLNSVLGVQVHRDRGLGVRLMVWGLAIRGWGSGVWNKG